jgi:hypothetical protein
LRVSASTEAAGTMEQPGGRTMTIGSTTAERQLKGGQGSTPQSLWLRNLAPTAAYKSNPCPLKPLAKYRWSSSCGCWTSWSLSRLAMQSKKMILKECSSWLRYSTLSTICCNLRTVSKMC